MSAYLAASLTLSMPVNHLAALDTPLFGKIVKRIYEYIVDKLAFRENTKSFVVLLYCALAANKVHKII